MSHQKQPADLSLVFRILAIALGSFCIWMGWAARSQGYAWHTGYNARMGTEATTPTLSWIIYGIWIVLASVFPWEWLVNRWKR